jgi:hypothetical protein
MLHWGVAFCGSETWTLRKADQFCNLVLEKNGDQLHGSYEKRSVAKSQGGAAYPTCNKMKGDYLDLLHLAYELLSKTRY